MQLIYRALSITALFFITLIYQGCGAPFAVYQESVTDLGSSSGEFDSLAAEQRFLAAKAVINNKCASCHSLSGPAAHFPLNFTNQTAFINSGAISTSGDISKSKIITRLKNYPDTNLSGRNMPANDILTDAEYSTLTNWVINISKNDDLFQCTTDDIQGSYAKRLSKKQLSNSIKEIIKHAQDLNYAVRAMNTVQFYDRFPDDTADNYNRSDNNFTPLHARSYFDLANQISLEVFKDQNRLKKFVAYFLNANKGSCQVNSNSLLSFSSNICRDIFLQNLVLRAYRRPILTAAENNELTSLKQEFDLTADYSEAVKIILFRILASPSFIFHLHIDQLPTSSSDIYRLSSYSIAAKLSYGFKNMPPDETLLTMATEKDLFDETHFNEALAYVTNQLETQMNEFTDEWLKLSDIENFIESPQKKSIHIKQNIIGNRFKADDVFITEMKNEIYELVSYAIQHSLNLSDLLTTDISFARNERVFYDDNPDGKDKPKIPVTVPGPLMAVYGIPLSSKAPNPTTPANAIRLPAGERSGLLTRAALLVSETADENPVLRGVRMRRELLCLDIPAPPPEIAMELRTPEINLNATTRERYHAKTSVGVCNSCHSLINPLGFAFSQYNAFGGFQTVEPIFQPSGEYANKDITTDARVDLSVALGANVVAADAIKFSQVMAQSPDFKKCLTRNYFAYFNQIDEKPQSEAACSMNQMSKRLDKKSNMKDFFKSAAGHINFRLRKMD